MSTTPRALITRVGRVRNARSCASPRQECIDFEPGVNLLVGPPNSGKTKWFETIDYLLGYKQKPGDLFGGAMVADYDSCFLHLLIGDRCYLVSRYISESFSHRRIYLSPVDLSEPATEFALDDWVERIPKLLGLPELVAPSGNPVARPWKRLGFRSLLRHIYRRQRSWGGLVDKQPESEQRLCILYFVGIARRIYTHDAKELAALERERELYGRSPWEKVIRDLWTHLDTEETFDVALDSIKATGEKRRQIQEQFQQLRTNNPSDLDAAFELGRSLGRVEEKENLLNLLCESEQARSLRAIQREIDARKTIRQELPGTAQINEALDVIAIGINEYLSQITDEKSSAWRHGDVSVRVSTSAVHFYVANRPWETVLGGSDSLIFLVAYQYALLRLGQYDHLHYPGFQLIDLPPDFLGEDIRDKENYIVRPFLELLRTGCRKDWQLIISGASFDGLECPRHVLNTRFTITE